MVPVSADHQARDTLRYRASGMSSVSAQPAPEHSSSGVLMEYVRCRRWSCGRVRVVGTNKWTDKAPLGAKPKMKYETCDECEKKDKRADPFKDYEGTD